MIQDSYFCIVSCAEKWVILLLIKDIVTIAANRSTKVYWLLGFPVSVFGGQKESAPHMSALITHIHFLFPCLVFWGFSCCNNLNGVSHSQSRSACFPVVVFVSFSIRSRCWWWWWCSMQAVLNKRAQGGLLWQQLCGCCLLAGQIGPLHMEPAPLVSFVFSPMVSTASCTNKREEDFPYFSTSFLKFHNSGLFHLDNILSNPWISLFVFICFSCSAFHRAITFFHGVLGASVPSCLFIFISPCVQINVEKGFSKLYHEPLTEKTDFGALKSTVCVMAADFKRLRALVAVLVADSLRSRENETGGVAC